MVPMVLLIVPLNHIFGASNIPGLTRLFTGTLLRLTGSKLRFRVSDKLEKNKSYLFVQNHVNHFDFVMLNNTIPHYTQGVELKKHFSYPFYGWFMKSRGTIPVEPMKKSSLLTMQKGFEEEVNKGHSILGFPEGTRTLDGKVGKFRHGLYYIALDMGLPIVPVAVTGTYQMMRKGSLVIRPWQTITVHVLDPIDVSGLDRGKAPELAKQTEEMIAAIVNPTV